MREVVLAITCVAVMACVPDRRAEIGDSQASLPAAATRGKLKGAGATFPYPLYARWAVRYLKEAGVRIAYDQVGSRAGVDAVIAGEVDFGATDIPLTVEELERGGLVQFPMVIGGVVPVVNLPGVEAGALVLSPDTLARIFLGEITRWNAEEIRTENPGVELPDREITPIHRADPSGTTWIFTRFLSDSCEKWRENAGIGATASWPVGVGARGNDQVVRFVRQFELTIGYVELTHARENGLAWVALKQNGQKVEPTSSAFERAAATATWQTGPSVTVVPCDPQPGDWPIVGASYLVLEKEPASASRVRKLLGFVQWALTDGAPLARELSYAAVPSEYVDTIEQLWRDQIRVNGRTVW